MAGSCEFCPAVGGGCSQCADLPEPGPVALVRAFPDGSAYVSVAGCQLSVGAADRSGVREVYGLDDWGRLNEFENAGILRRDVWNGSGLEGHDTYFLVRPVA